MPSATGAAIGRWRAWLCGSALALCGALLPAPAYAAGSSNLGGPELPAACMQALLAGQDALQRMDFEGAHRLTQQGIAQQAGHPLPRIFLQGVYLYEIQESILAGKLDPGLLERFYQESATAIQMAEALDAAAPSARSRLYLGGAYGCRGMARLYEKSYWKSYQDGKRAYADLREAVARDPGLFNAYLGLGQFQYFCGRMQGLLQFVLSMHGDVPAALQNLKACALKGDYASIPAKLFLCQVLITDQKDYQAALPFILEARACYPENYHYCEYMVMEAEGLGWQEPQSLRAAQRVFSQVEQGGLAPGCHFDFKAHQESMRQALAAKERPAL